MQYTELIMLMCIEVVMFDKCVVPVQTKVVHQPNPVIAASAGEEVTLQCFLLEEQNTDPIVWYKQAAGLEPSLVAVVQKVQDPIYNKELNYTRFRIEKENKSCNLRIINVEASDEAVYYCGMITFYTVFAKGTFLSVKVDGDVKVSVFQSSVSDLVPAGASVTLQCSVLSESRAAELQVLWFRAAPSQSHPQIIYTHHNSSLQCESESSTHTCVYNLSKNIFSLNDTGTYYCAVVLCGKIIFGNGTRVQLEDCVMSLGTVLVMCGILISVQAALLCKRKNSQQHRARIQHGAVINTEKMNTQGRDAPDLNYAALNFNDRKLKELKKMKVDRRTACTLK
ncbi:uncharacterized protein LOC124386264 isoform X2 [Silurus meridionalis]|uniref:uncharacterized protein LOC124386264 isoform X2 n=1 Tax=Silurus meridionalis TaxID=175797 RepID=UPI001EEB925A|nr:uncharacterized protein LOC124386264 isoform X2 [Silurus meridionalis]